MWRCLFSSFFLPIICCGQTAIAPEAPASATTQTATTPPTRDIAKRIWPASVLKVEIPSSDGTLQPAMWYSPATSDKKPLLVGLHTWSSTYASAGGDAIFAEWAIAQGWAFVHPHFRGPNNTPEAMGSDRAIQDIVEAVAWAKQQTSIDESRIYLIGGSGGAHMSLLMAGRHPEIWAAVSAWCGISDITAWHAFHTTTGKPSKYALDIEATLGGSPSSDETRKTSAWQRSPLASLANAKSIPLDINHGINDGRIGSVPFIHSLNAFNATVENSADQLAEADIASYYETQQLPAAWQHAADDPVYGFWKPLFRKTSANTRITIFQGGHELIHQAALNWLSLQRKGLPPQWVVKDFTPLETGGGETAK